MSDVRTIIRLCPRQPDVLHDFVLALLGYFVTRTHNLYSSPVRILCDFLVDEIRIWSDSRAMNGVPIFIGCRNRSPFQSADNGRPEHAGASPSFAVCKIILNIVLPHSGSKPGCEREPTRSWSSSGPMCSSKNRTWVQPINQQDLHKHEHGCFMKINYKLALIGPGLQAKDPAYVGMKQPSIHFNWAGFRFNGLWNTQMST